MEHGANRETYENLLDLGADIPEAVPPGADDAIRWYLEAFSFLSSGRPVGLGPGPIPLQDMLIYAEHLGLVGRMDTFLRVMRALDIGYLQWTADKSKQQKG